VSGQRLGPGQVWAVRFTAKSWPPQTPGEAVVLTLEVGPPHDKGFREVECLALEGELAGRRVTLSNGAFAAPNKRIA